MDSDNMVGSKMTKSEKKKNPKPKQTNLQDP